MHRDFERDDPRRRYRRDDDPRDDPRERYGNEEDPWSREYRRAYAEGDLPRRMHDDRPYDRPGYEPESGRPGGRENVDARSRPARRLRATRSTGAAGAIRTASTGSSRPIGAARFPGDRSPRRPLAGRLLRPGSALQRTAVRARRPRRLGHATAMPGGARQFGQGGRQERYRPPSYGPPPSPYDEGDVGSWYGGDTGMGDAGSRAGQRCGRCRRPSTRTATAARRPSSSGSEYGEQLGGQERRQYGSQYGSGGRFGAAAARRAGSAGADRAATVARTSASARTSVSC